MMVGTAQNCRYSKYCTLQGGLNLYTVTLPAATHREQGQEGSRRVVYTTH
jgi:hypothetical protein